MLGSAAATLLVEDSVFEMNAVRASQESRDIAVTVRVNTGAFAIKAEGARSDHVPIWRIDDGPVYGIPWAQCQLALQHSLDAVSKGLPTSWPRDLQCANVSYTGPDASYSRVVALAPAIHRYGERGGGHRGEPAERPAEEPQGEPAPEETVPPQ